ncbi:hypothetical protein [Sulfitobacter sp. R18_1]|uniref:hypothetical protein n=1 Tax=Sulfitobacter sp. R18_1 TaxID=2821104 RepID=UPI001ADA8887|nr:hypothetical protein [Sulfitobacter sp. R18_1]MBO9428064.1 hypothetical protein [Sulfitobacter sp. R18_1]
MPALNHYRKPPNGPCSKAPKIFGLFWRSHIWEFSTSWNSNTRRILPWVKRSSGVGRAGWRCSGCGEFYWGVDDATFAENYAMATDPSMKFAVNQRRGLDRWGRDLSHYDRCVTLKGHPFVAERTDESITVRCNKEIVARWSTGEVDRDLTHFVEWTAITGAIVEGADKIRGELWALREDR